MENIPEKLYKYESLDIHKLDALNCSYLYFAPPESFNDPFDCSLFIETLKITDEDFPEYFEEIFNEGVEKHLSNIKKEGHKFISDKFEYMKNKKSQTTDKINFVNDMIKKGSKQSQDHVLKKIGITCLSEFNDNILMWGHYSKGHKGYCLEFDTQKFPEEFKENAFHVIYKEGIHIYEPEKSFLKKYSNLPFSEKYPQLFTKSDHWKYEEEWRIINPSANSKETYNPEALSSIIFGLNMSDNDKNIIKNIFKDKVYKPKYIEPTLSKSEYKIVIP